MTLQIWKVESQSFSFQKLQKLRQSFLNTLPLGVKSISNQIISFIKIKILLKINYLQNFCCYCEVLLIISTKCIVCRNWWWYAYLLFQIRRIRCLHNYNFCWNYCLQNINQYDFLQIMQKDLQWCFQQFIFLAPKTFCRLIYFLGTWFPGSTTFCTSA